MKMLFTFDFYFITIYKTSLITLPKQLLCLGNEFNLPKDKKYKNNTVKILNAGNPKRRKLLNAGISFPLNSFYLKKCS